MSYHSFWPQMVSLKGPETAICIDVPLGSQYCVKIRAKPTGSIYTGHWSDWSDVFTGETPADKGMLTLSTAWFLTDEIHFWVVFICVNQVILTAIQKHPYRHNSHDVHPILNTDNYHHPHRLFSQITQVGLLLNTLLSLLRERHR